MKKWIIGLVTCLLVIAFYITNCTIMNWSLPHEGPYRYVDNLGGFEAEAKFKVMTYDDVIRSFNAYAAVSPQEPILFRCYKRNWLHIWDWVSYCTHPGYDLPYKKCDPPKTK